MSSSPSSGLTRAFPLRIALWYAALFVLSAAAIAAVTYVLLARALAEQDHVVLESMLGRYAVEYERSGLAGLRALIEADAGEGRHERLLVRVIGRQAQVVYFAEPPGWDRFDLSKLDDPGAWRGGWASLYNPPDGSVLEVGATLLPRGIVVQVGRSSHVRDELLGHFRARALQWLALVVLVGVGGGALLTHVALTPLRALESTVRTILRTGRFDARVAVRDTRDPLDELGRLVNDMLGRIQRLVGGMRGALDNVAHDLRTPLTRFRAVGEAALLSDDAAAVRDGLARALEEAERVNATLTALMDISEAETGTMALERGVVDVNAVVAEAVDLHADEADDKGVALSVAAAPPARVLGDRTRLRQVLANLIENAVKFTDTGGRVEVAVTPADGHVTIAVADSGVGIAAPDLPHVWDRLYRGDASRSTRGLGLGLSLVKAIVEAHGGTVGVTSQPGGGSTFSVVLPAAPPPAGA